MLMGNAFTADRERNITPKRKVFFLRYTDIWNTQTIQEKMVAKKADTKVYIPPKRGQNTERENNE
jgi:hypothetical protein